MTTAAHAQTRAQDGTTTRENTQQHDAHTEDPRKHEQSTYTHIMKRNRRRTQTRAQLSTNAQTTQAQKRTGTYKHAYQRTSTHSELSLRSLNFAVLVAITQRL